MTRKRKAHPVPHNSSEENTEVSDETILFEENKPHSPSKKTTSKKEEKQTKEDPRKEKRRDKLFQNLLKITYEFIKGKRYSPLNKLTLIERLQIHPDHLDIFESVLHNLHDEGKIKITKDKYLPTVEQTENNCSSLCESPKQQLIPANEQNQPQPTAPKNGIIDIVTGTLKAHPRGFGFVQVEGESQDVFIPKPFMNGAVDGDVVEVQINLNSISEKGPEGKILTIAKRKHSQLVGIVFQVTKDTATIISNLLGDKNFATCVLDSKESRELKVGDRILLEVLEWGSKKENTKTRLIKNLGHISDPKVDVQVAILEHNIRAEFPLDVQNEAKSFGERVKAKDLVEREDFRELECFTIDPDTAKDYDDALSLEKKGENYVIGVHIADVSHYVKQGSALDIEAQKRCNSTYFPGTCVPMLPFELSNNLCSLKEGVVRLTVSVMVTIDSNGNVKHSKVVRSCIKSRKRFTYKQAKLVIDGTLKSKHRDTLLEMQHVCSLLKNKRKERGSVELFMPELVVLIDENGDPKGTEIVQYDITHQLVEEFMLLANETVAKYLASQGKELTYRVHEEPSKESLREFGSLAEAFGHKLSQDPTPEEIQKFFVAIENEPFIQYISTCYIRSMRLACYSADNIGHYGLSLGHYCHFTSPIRRYVDIIAHRLLFEKPQEKKTITKICELASEKERISARAEASVLNLKKLRLLEKLNKQQQNRQFEAIVTRVKPFGIYFDVLELMYEGFLHISELDNDYFIFDEKRLRLVGKHHKVTYRASDPLFVSIKDIDFITQEVIWELNDHENAHQHVEAKILESRHTNSHKEKRKSIKDKKASNFAKGRPSRRTAEKVFSKKTNKSRGKKKSR